MALTLLLRTALVLFHDLFQLVRVTSRIFLISFQHDVNAAVDIQAEFHHILDRTDGTNTKRWSRTSRKGLQ